MYKNVLHILFIFCFSFSGLTQRVFPYVNNQFHLKSFYKGQSYQLDHLLPVDVKYTEDFIAYIDNKNDLFVFDGERRDKLSGLVNNYKIGRNVIAWNSGPIINVWQNGRKQNLTYFGGFYEVSDSLVVYEDTRDNAIRVFYNGEIIELYSSIGRPYFPSFIGSNTVAFVGNGDVNYVFVAGEIQEVGVFSEQIKYACGANLLVFNDPFNQSFAVAFQGSVLDVESTMVEDYKAGDNSFVYLDRNENLMGYVDGEIIQLSSYASFYDIFRDMIVWGENGTFYCYYNGEKTEIANYIPDSYKIRDGIVAFRNVTGGVSVFNEGKVEILSNKIFAPFEVNGNTVRVQVSKGNYDFYKNGFSYPTTKN